MKSFAFAVFAFAGLSCVSATLKNDVYCIEALADGALKLTASENGAAAEQILIPEFTVMYSPKNPGYAVNHRNYLIAPRTSVRWSNYEESADAVNDWLNSAEGLETVGCPAELEEDSDGVRHYVFKNAKTGKVTLKVDAAYSKGTVRPFAVGEKFICKAADLKEEAGGIKLTFADNPDFDLSAFISLPAGDGAPKIWHKLTAKKDGWFSVAFTGAQGIAKSKAKWMPQEVSGRSYRQYNHLVPEGALKLPRAQITTDALSAAIVADSACSPFRIPNRDNSLFGLMLQSEGGFLKPMAFAPIMGGANSKLKKGQSVEFAVRYILTPENDWMKVFKRIAVDYYGFKDMRDNSGAGSLNDAFFDTIDYLKNADGNNYAMWHDEQKYYDYWCDNTGIFKPFSLLYGLSACVVADDLEFYDTRVLPHTEFTLSRKDSVFAPYEVEDNNMVRTRNRNLGSAYCGTAELLGIASFYGMKTPYIADMIKRKGFADSYEDALAKAEFTGDASAVKDALSKIKTRTKDKRVTFIQYQDYLDLYDATHEPYLLELARIGAYSQLTNMNFFPEVRDVLTEVDEGGSPVHDHSYGRHKSWGFPRPQKYPIPAQTVPQWRVSLNGLESPAYRGEYWMHHHGQLMRLGALTNDELLKNVARWGFVGRFAMFPGDNRSKLSLISEYKGVVNNPMWMLTFATVNPGHAWEFVGELLDFLVSDAFEKSGGAIDFPSRAMPESPFRVRVYGDRAGKFYDAACARLWMPKGLVHIDNKQIDYLSAYDGDNFYIAFLNRSAAAETFKVSFDPKRLEVRGAARGLDAVSKGKNFDFDGGASALEIPPKGILALAIPAKLTLGLQAVLFDGSKPLGAQSFAELKADFGTVYAYLLKLGDKRISAHIYTDALPSDTISARLKYRIDNGEWRELEDAIFPYEYTLKLPENSASVEAVLIHENADGTFKESSPFILKK